MRTLLICLLLLLPIVVAATPTPTKPTMAPPAAVYISEDDSTHVGVQAEDGILLTTYAPSTVLHNASVTIYFDAINHHGPDAHPLIGCGLPWTIWMTNATGAYVWTDAPHFRCAMMGIARQPWTEPSNTTFVWNGLVWDFEQRAMVHAPPGSYVLHASFPWVDQAGWHTMRTATLLTVPSSS